MEKLLNLLNQAKEENPQIIDNLHLILKKEYGKLRKFKFTTTNYKLIFNGNANERVLIFQNEVAQYVEKYGKEMCRCFFDFWSELTPDGMKMKKEREITWETEKRMRTWKRNEERYRR